MPAMTRDASKRKADESAGSGNQSLDSNHPTKRLRQNSNKLSTRTSPQYRGVEEDDDMWFQDGSIVLVTKTTAFKVHGGLLARRSTVLADMLCLANPDPIGSLYEGCVAVDVTDGKDAMRSFLQAIYGGSNFTLQLNSHADYVTLENVLRLSDKYGVRDLKAKTVALISKAWPSTLAEFDIGEQMKRTRPRDNVWGWPYTSPRKIVLLATQADVRLFLPSAYESLSNWYWQTRASFTGPETERPPLVLPGLDDSVFRRLQSFKENLHEATLTFIRDICYERRCTLDPNAYCTQYCLWLSALLSLSTSVRSKNPFSVMDKAVRIVHEHNRKPCATCCTSFLEDVAKEREKVWNLMPSFLGLPSWEELRTEQEITAAV